MLFHIALMSITKEVSLAQLAPVSAAIQKQICRALRWRLSHA
jgi:hypothetical protein